MSWNARVLSVDRGRAVADGDLITSGDRRSVCRVGASGGRQRCVCFVQPVEFVWAQGLPWVEKNRKKKVVLSVTVDGSLHLWLAKPPHRVVLEIPRLGQGVLWKQETQKLMSVAIAVKKGIFCLAAIGFTSASSLDVVEFESKSQTWNTLTLDDFGTEKAAAVTHVAAAPQSMFGIVAVAWPNTIALYNHKGRLAKVATSGRVLDLAWKGDGALYSLFENAYVDEFLVLPSKRNSVQLAKSTRHTLPLDKGLQSSAGCVYGSLFYHPPSKDVACCWSRGPENGINFSTLAELENYATSRRLLKLDRKVRSAQIVSSLGGDSFLLLVNEGTLALVFWSHQQPVSNIWVGPEVKSFPASRDCARLKVFSENLALCQYNDGHWAVVAPFEKKRIDFFPDGTIDAALLCESMVAVLIDGSSDIHVYQLEIGQRVRQDSLPEIPRAIFHDPHNPFKVLYEVMDEHGTSKLYCHNGQPFQGPHWTMLNGNTVALRHKHSQEIICTLSRPSLGTVLGLAAVFKDEIIYYTCSRDTVCTTAVHPLSETLSIAEQNNQQADGLEAEREEEEDFERDDHEYDSHLLAGYWRFESQEYKNLASHPTAAASIQPTTDCFQIVDTVVGTNVFLDPGDPSAVEEPLAITGSLQVKLEQPAHSWTLEFWFRLHRRIKCIARVNDFEIERDNIPLAQWRHFAIVYDHVQQMLYLYLDGLLLDRMTESLRHTNCVFDILPGSSDNMSSECTECRVWTCTRSREQIIAWKDSCLNQADAHWRKNKISFRID